jgi:hypothetical protein
VQGSRLRREVFIYFFAVQPFSDLLDTRAFH